MKCLRPTCWHTKATPGSCVCRCDSRDCPCHGSILIVADSNEDTNIALRGVPQSASGFCWPACAIKPHWLSCPAHSWSHLGPHCGSKWSGWVIRGIISPERSHRAVCAFQKQPLLWVHESSFRGREGEESSIKSIHICRHFQGWYNRKRFLPRVVHIYHVKLKA